MSGPIGVMSHKIILRAGLLLLTARIDLHSVSATLDPSTPVTAIDTNAARYVGRTAASSTPQTLEKRHVIGIDHAELKLATIVVRPTSPPTQLVIGADLLRDMIISLNFPRGTLHLFDQAEYRHIGTGMTSVPIAVSPRDRCLQIEARDATGAKVRLALVGQPPQTSDGKAPISLSVGGVPLTATSKPVGAGICPDAEAIASWEIFQRANVTIDLGHDRLWIAPQ